MEPGCRIAGHVYNEQGKPLKSAKVTIYPAGQRVILKSQTLLTDDEGCFEGLGFSEGMYDAEIEAIKGFPIDYADIDSIVIQNIRPESLELKFTVKISNQHKEDYQKWMRGEDRNLDDDVEEEED